MKVQKRDGTKEDFLETKIRRAIEKANNSKKVDDSERLSSEQVDKVFAYVMKIMSKWQASLRSEDIQEVVKQGLMKYNHYAVAEAYIVFVNDKQKNEKYTPEEKQFIALVQNKNEEARGDNANKKTTMNASMRDYGTGFICKSIFSKEAPKDIAKAHRDADIHFHDADYFYQPLTNCGLVDSFDMFENGFVMTGKHIDKPGTFKVGCNLLAQVALQVSGSQYGGQTVSWASLLPALRCSKVHIAYEFVQDVLAMNDIEIDYKNIKGETPDEIYDLYLKDYLSKDAFNKVMKKRIREEVRFGVKTYQWQILCHMSSNGQTPFVTNVLNLREAETQEELDDLALIIEEMLKRRIKGVKDEHGHMSTPLFPKLLYWGCKGLNMEPSDPYYYLTELAADCMIKRMAPDLNSEEKCREMKNGQIIPSMGCRSVLSPLWEDNVYPIDTKFHWQEITETNKQYSGAYDQNFDYSRGLGEYSAIPLDKHVVLNFRGNSGWVVAHDKSTITIREPKVYGRWNMGVVSLNIPKVALDAKEKGVDFWQLFDERLELVRRALLFRWDTLKNTCHAYNSPILWQYGGYDRVPANTTLKEMHEAHPGRSSISVGFSGLSETCWALIGKSNTSEEGQELSKQILYFMNKKCDEWRGEWITKEEELPDEFDIAI